ncbi:hypothetical protein CKO25_03780 [Thiocapsa imhoffii]|uniref:DUF2934 domain-containing protein n=2 Tax=Thiocapsa imhoffii TaxID=382777 RepID=A0A9X0WGJ7_9GAMM|nr:hypothetical protein [Thiocapsa imhoffii]
MSEAPSTHERHEMIALAAYYLAERRGFAPGGAQSDWLIAEAAVDALIASGAARTARASGTLREGLRNALKLSD